MEKFHPAMSFSANVNCVSSVVSPTTMGDHHRLVDVASLTSRPAPAPSLVSGCSEGQGRVAVDVMGSSRPDDMTSSSEDSVSRKLEASLSVDAKQKIENLLNDIKKLDDKQKLWLYLQLPSGGSEQDAACKSSSPMLSSCRMEQTAAVNWVRSHIEESTDTSLPKQEVYEEYRSFCENTNHRPLSAADFGKVIKSVFPAVQARRLGTRGNSRYCYSGMRKKLELTSPSLPPLDAPSIKLGTDSILSPCPSCPTSLLSMEDDHLQMAAGQVICEWASGVLTKSFASSLQLAQHITGSKLVNKSSKSILIIQSHMGEGHRLDLTPEMRHKETNYHLKQALQYRQEIRKKQAEENQQRLHEGSGEVNSRRVAAMVAEDELAPPQILRTDKATQLEQKDVPAGRELPSTNSLTLPDGSESSTSTENQMSSSNVCVGDVGTVASKESPGKRRFAPIQPKTPVRDTNAPVVLISPSAKNVSGQSMQLVVVNGVNRQKVIPVQGISKLTSPPQMNVILQGQNVFQSPVQAVTAVGNQTPVNVMSSPVVGNTVLSSPVTCIPASSIQNAIKSGQVVFVGNQVKQVRNVCSGLQPVSNTNAAIRQNPGQTVTPGQVAVVAQAAPPQPHSVVSTSSVACQKSVLSSQGININTGTTSNMRSQNMTPVFIEHTAHAPAPAVTSPVSVMTHAASHHNARHAPSSNVIVRTAPSSVVHIPNSNSVVASGPSTLTTSVTFATQPMKLLSSVAVIGSDSFQGNCVLSNVSQSGIDLTNTNVPSHFAITNPVVASNKIDKNNPLNRPTKSVVNALPSEICRSGVTNSKASLVQNGSGKTVASLLRSAQATTALASASLPKASSTSTAAEASGNFVLAQVHMPGQGVSSQRDSNMQHILIQTAPEDVSSPAAASSERDVPTTPVSGIRGIMLGSQELAQLQQPGSILSGILTDKRGIRQPEGKGGIAIQQVTFEDAPAVINQLITQPSVSLLPETESNANPMLVVSGMSAATMLPHRSKPGETTLISHIPQTHPAPAISSKVHQQSDILSAALLGKQCTKMVPLPQVQNSQPKMLERLLASENFSYFSAPLRPEMRSARSVPTTPIEELQSPPPHMIRAQSAAIPMHQGGDSVPPSPSDGKSFAFTPISTIETEGEDSPNKPKHKPKATHPVSRNILNQTLLSNELQDNSQEINPSGKGKGKRAPQSEFVTPTRKRRLSSNSKRMAASSPSCAQFQTQIRQNIPSPAPNQVIQQQQQQQTLLIPNTQQSSGLSIPTRNLQLNTAFPPGSGQNQQVNTWQRRRNPSGPACPVNLQTQELLETELLNLLNNATNSGLQAMLTANKKAIQNRSQSVPLPEHAANRMMRFQLPTQQEVSQVHNPDGNRVVILSADQFNQVQDGAASNFAAKRNLTQDLLDLEVTDEDFAPVNALLNTGISAAPNLQQVSDLVNPSWQQTQDQPTVASDPGVSSQMADFALKYDAIADQQNGNHSQQSLLPSSQAFNDASNSTASSISDNMMIDDLKVFEDLEEAEGFDLPPTPWQMGTSSTNLSTLECGM